MAPLTPMSPMSPMAPLTPVPPIPPGYVTGFARPAPAGGLGTATVVLFAVVSALALLRLVADFDFYSALDNPWSAYAASLDEEFGEFWGATVFLLGIGFLGAIPVFLCWFHRVRTNAEVLAPGAHRTPPGMAIGAWFIPLANWWIPKQITDDIVAVSDPAPVGPYGQPLRRPGSGAVNAWWITWVASSAFAVIAWLTLFSVDRGEIETARTALMFFVLSDLLLIAAGIAGLIAVRQISVAQDVRLGFRRPAGPLVPPPGPPRW